MAIQVKHTKVSTVPDDTDTSLVRPSDWNADHTLVGLGTMAEQNANAVAITGGTINGTTIGATSATTVNATTLSGQTGVLRGTGQNFLTQSQTFTAWGVGTVTVTASATTAPDSTSTASSILSNSTSTNNFISRTASSTLTNTTYTLSVYAKKLDSNFINLTVFDGANGSRYWFNISTGVLGSTAAVGSGFTNLSGTITSAGNGWYRCTLTATTLSVTSIQVFLAFTDADASLTQTTAKTNYIWGAQLELGSTANTYIPTTTTAVYGTPTLSFSGVSTLGLESNGALFLQPAGTGAIQAQATTSTTAGGNVRGANAVDWQTNRNGATQVASGSYAVVAGGQANTASQYAATVAGGSGSTASNTYTFVGSGASSVASGFGASVVAGYTNTAAGYWNFIGNGFTNSGTSGSAVTTQSGTMNGTTAVTLSGSNANIKVGQLITGTSINTFPNTYVAAISGTSLTLSQNASGSSTSTLSFFTPHGVVVGGGNNQATGSYSFIGGGGDAGTAANRNVASGDWSVVGGGQANQATGIGSVVAGGGTFGSGGTGNTASGVSSFIGSGFGNSASDLSSSVLGSRNTASGDYSSCLGGRRGTTRSIQGNTAFVASSNPIADVSGTSQTALLVLGTQTTDATATALRSNQSAAGTTNQVILPNNSAYFFTGEIVSGKTAGGDTKGWTIEGVIKRGANAASTTLVGVTVTSMYADVGAATWAIAVTADTTNGGIRVTFTGQASTTIRTVCQIRTTEMTY